MSHPAFALISGERREELMALYQNAWMNQEMGFTEPRSAVELVESSFLELE